MHQLRIVSVVSLEASIAFQKWYVYDLLSASTILLGDLSRRECHFII